MICFTVIGGYVVVDGQMDVVYLVGVLLGGKGLVVANYLWRTAR